MAPSPAAAAPTFAQSLLDRAHEPQVAAQIFVEKLLRRSLYLRPSSPPPATTNARDARRRARAADKARRKALRPKPLSSRQRRALGLHEVPRAGQKYATFEPLHRLWLGYIREVLGLGGAGPDPGAAGRSPHAPLPGGPEAAAARLSSADMHGAEMEVVRSGCVSRVGIKGIVVKDAKFVFEIVTRKNCLKTVPKEGTIFRVEVPPVGQESEVTGKGPLPGQQQQQQQSEVEGALRSDEMPKLIFEIHGDQFMLRSADRANKKFKQHFLKKL